MPMISPPLKLLAAQILLRSITRLRFAYNNRLRIAGPVSCVIAGVLVRITFGNRRLGSALQVLIHSKGKQNERIFAITLSGRVDQPLRSDMLLQNVSLPQYLHIQPNKSTKKIGLTCHTIKIR